MTRERLQMLSMEELLALARSDGYELSEPTDRSTLIESILETFEEQKRERRRENNSSVRVEEAKFEATAEDEASHSEADALPVPRRYNQTRITFLARDPHWAFAFWELDDHDVSRVQKADPDKMVLRVHDVEAPPGDGSRSGFSFDIPVRLEDSSWYIYLPSHDCSYVVEVGMLSAGRYACLARSNTIRTPREAPAQAADAQESSAPSGVFFDLLWDLPSFGEYSSSEAIPQRILTELKD